MRRKELGRGGSGGGAVANNGRNEDVEVTGVNVSDYPEADNRPSFTIPSTTS